MSTINPKELQKFMDVWAPVIAVLPAVINAAERSEELKNHVAILEDRMAKVQEEITWSLMQKRDEVAKAEEDLARIAALKVQALSEIDESKRSNAQAIAESKKATLAKIAEYEARVFDYGAKVAQAAENLRQGLAQADRDFMAHAAEKQKMIEELEAKRVAAEKALDKIKAKLE